MDTITHGIAGALIGKAFFAPEAKRSRSGSIAGDTAELRAARLGVANRVAIFAATIGAVFPDGDVVFSLFDQRSVASLELHRGFTHSFLCMPLFAVMLALLTRWICRWRGWAAPSFGALSMIYAAGITSHIVLDLITSYGTMIWSPLSNYRAALDLTFIVDFVLTTIALAPQVAAWAYRTPLGSWWRRIFGWAFFALGAAGVHWLAGRAGYGFSTSVVWIAAAIFAALFFLPALQRWGYGVGRATWCRAGIVALVLYLGVQEGAQAP